MPVCTPQPTSAAEVIGTSGGILTACVALSTARSANTDELAKLYAGSPRQVNGWPCAPNVDRHIVGRPAVHASHAPQLAIVVSTTWSPSATLVTPAPTASTTPAPSCPSTTGVGNGMVPLMTDRSL